MNIKKLKKVLKYSRGTKDSTNTPVFLGLEQISGWKFDLNEIPVISAFFPLIKCLILLQSAWNPVVAESLGPQEYFNTIFNTFYSVSIEKVDIYQNHIFCKIWKTSAMQFERDEHSAQPSILKTVKEVKLAYPLGSP